MNKTKEIKQGWDAKLEVLLKLMPDGGEPLLRQLISAEISQAEQRTRDEILIEVKKYQCDFNWDFEKDKARHKSYVALDKIIEVVSE